MINEDLITIIIPVYNVEQYLERCLESVIRQSYKNLEIMIVNDGSTDSSLKIADTFKERDQRITIINQSNAGLSAARNTGIAASNGKYLSFVDSDDYIHRQFIELLYLNAEKYKADIAVCEGIEVDDVIHGNRSKAIQNEYQIMAAEPIDAMKVWYRSDFKNPTVAWNKLYRRDLFNECKFPVGKIHEDEFIMHHLYLKSKKVLYLWLELYFYYQRDNSITGKNAYTLKRLDVLEAYEDRRKVFEDCADQELSKLHNQQYIDVLLGCASDFVKYGMPANRKSFFKFIKKRLTDVQGGCRVSLEHYIKAEIFSINPMYYCKIYNFIKKVIS